MKRNLAIILAFLPLLLSSQVENPVRWTFSQKQISSLEFDLVFTASIQRGWHMYGLNIPSGPIPTSFTFNPNPNISLEGDVVAVTKPAVKEDPFFNVPVELYDGKAFFSQRVKLKSVSEFTLKGSIEFMSCNDNQCTPPKDEEFSFLLKPVSGDMSLNGSKEIDTIPPPDTLTRSLEQGNDSTLISQESNHPATTKPKRERSLWAFFFISFLAGLGGILTPCVYPMIPMTVSFFMRGQQSRSRGVVNALVFGFSIILIYTLIGVLVSLSKGGTDAANQLSTHWIPNSLFFLLFVVFAISFFGVFEIILPSFLANKADQQADKGGLSGAFFMALTTVIVSFSCTGPIVGGLLVEAAGGLALKPILGMFGFSLAFSLPFTIFALFPSMLKNLPKSGGWLNSVKIVLGFVMLIFSLKFLSNIDQSYHLGILGREIYLSLWIALFGLLGLYLLGKIHFAHDTKVEHLSVFRMFLALASFTFMIYLIPGVFGAPLNKIGALLPPQKEQSFLFSSAIGSGEGYSQANSNSLLCSPPRYSDFLELPYGLKGYFDYAEGMACAKEKNMPVFLDFKGHACANCKKMEATVWSDPRVLQRLRDNFIIIALYVDDRTALPESEWVTSSFDGKAKKTIGKKNSDLQITMFGSNTQPLYAITDTMGKQLVQPVGVTGVEDFIRFLDEGAAAFRK